MTRHITTGAIAVPITNNSCPMSTLVGQYYALLLALQLDTENILIVRLVRIIALHAHGKQNWQLCLCTVMQKAYSRAVRAESKCKVFDAALACVPLQGRTG